jgi:hypothetical protein
LSNGWSSISNWEEEFWVDVATGGAMAPIHIHIRRHLTTSLLIMTAQE